MALEKLSTIEELDQLLQEKDRVLFLKNSTTCPVSHEAFRQYEELANELEETIYYLNVQEARPFSNQIAEQFAVKHESPQALLFKNGKVTWHDSHWKITYKNLKAILN
ncbi:bacillithiol system redox-active protein YtxJ [Anaerobacillus isosaccharinicus]|uniref:Bacillithiol system redox-active protein YtxJ n=1 Tax=Anaerobacillus isosaccharinicus TaxID=1532552 RepID=A0A1S2LSB8_9BACI|nr:bacillithiol system redox-active protein YtxJ [Anaerobacillus isosaccharinicus]MBA5587996.1 bacillithiol system redox-active protein YtxJ [Anaerobacillus isosaccharinicus]QOY33858.1 bacillithiol system redox-active protein YtxJ [Anaerobacillus isosaccharinicus]